MKVIIKPHHFLDLLYDFSVNDRHIGEINNFGNNNAFLSNCLQDGEFTTVIFTPFVDDICSPCKNLVEGGRCIDYFDDETTLYYGFRYKNDFNYQLDLKLNKALPNIFCFDKSWNILDLLYALKDNLKDEIIELYKWNRENRNENTFIGINKAIELYKNKKSV